LTFAWQVLVALFATSMRGLLLLMVLAVAIASVVAGLLLRFGDRGAAVGVAVAVAFGGSVTAGIAAVRWLTLGWPL
jgi:hypothetical protein